MKKKVNKRMFRLGAVLVVVDLFMTYFTSHTSGVILPTIGVLLIIRSFDPKFKKALPRADERSQLINMKVNSALLQILGLLSAAVYLVSAVLQHFSVAGLVAQELTQLAPAALGILTIIFAGSILLEKYYQQKL